MTPSTVALLDEASDDASDTVQRDFGDVPQGMLASPTRTRL